MRHALGRILWIVPSLALVSLLAFVILVGASAGATGFGGDVRTERRLRELPLFLNPSPADVRSLAHDAAARIARGDPDAAAAATTLVRLGGAALPHLLPTLEALPPAGRARVALALMPIAHRMDIPSAEEVHGSDAALLFWQRFWEDRGLDFRPAVVRRAVRRAAQEASATRREEIRELDTFALAELVDALGSVSAREDVERVARVTALLEPLASACAAVPSDASVAAPEPGGACSAGGRRARLRRARAPRGGGDDRRTYGNGFDWLAQTMMATGILSCSAGAAGQGCCCSRGCSEARRRRAAREPLGGPRPGPEDFAGPRWRC